MSKTISVRIPDELARKIKELGINCSEVVRSALKNAVKTKELEIALESLKKISRLTDKIDIDNVVRMIREDRER